MCFFDYNCLPAGLLGLGGGPVSSGGRGSSVPVGGSGTGSGIGPLTGGGEASGGSLPVTGGGEAGLNGGNTLLLNTRELLLLNLLLGLSLGVAVYRLIVRDMVPQTVTGGSGGYIQK